MSAHRRILFAAACFLLLFRAPEASAQDVGVFQFFVNLQPKGEVFVRQERDGLWIKISDLRAAGLVDLKGDTRALSGEPHMRLESIKGAMMDVDDAELRAATGIEVVFGPGMMVATLLSLPVRMTLNAIRLRKMKPAVPPGGVPAASHSCDAASVIEQATSGDGWLEIP